MTAPGKPARVDARTLRDRVLDPGSWKTWDSPVPPREVGTAPKRWLGVTRDEWAHPSRVTQARWGETNWRSSSILTLSLSISFSPATIPKSMPKSLRRI